MLYLTRKVGESVIINDTIEVTVIEVLDVDPGRAGVDVPCPSAYPGRVPSSSERRSAMNAQRVTTLRLDTVPR